RRRSGAPQQGAEEKKDCTEMDRFPSFHSVREWSRTAPKGVYVKTAKFVAAWKRESGGSTSALSPSGGIFVGRAGCGQVARDLCACGMRARQRPSERNAAAGDLCACCVRILQWRADGDRRAPSAAAGRGDDRRLLVRAAVDRDALTGAEADCGGDRDRGGARIDG